jgi:NAD dependent epimerase/dehydratase family enzyme
MSWIAISDMVSLIHHAINCESLHGPVNAVAPNPVTNSEFSKTLSKVLSRPAIFALPAFSARLAFGKMADEALLSSCRALPARLIESGYRFSFPRLEGALRHILHKPIM